MNKLTQSQKKWWVSIHLLFVIGMLGHVMIFLVLSLAASLTNDPAVLKACYISMEVIERPFVPIMAIGTVISGVLLSIKTHWGLVKYYWIIAKNVFTIIAIVIGIFGVKFWSMNGINMMTTDGVKVLQNPELTANTQYLLIGSIYEFLSLSFLVIISIFKPWGKRKIHN